jgi:hypothetical protein
MRLNVIERIVVCKGRGTMTHDDDDSEVIVLQAVVSSVDTHKIARKRNRLAETVWGRRVEHEPMLTG